MKRALMFFVLFFIAVNLAYATPPSEVNLAYDEQKQVLSVEVRHLTKKKRENYIKKLIVYKNEEEVETLNYTYQLLPKGLTKEILLKAESGDVIKVLVICNEYGKKEAVLEVL